MVISVYSKLKNLLWTHDVSERDLSFEWGFRYLSVAMGCGTMTHFRRIALPTQTPITFSSLAFAFLVFFPTKTWPRLPDNYQCLAASQPVSSATSSHFRISSRKLGFLSVMITRSANPKPSTSF